MNFLLYGSGEFATTVGELVRHCGHEVVGMVDDWTRRPGVLGTLDEVVKQYPPEQFRLAIAIGYSDLRARWNAIDRAVAVGYQLPPLVHPAAYVADSVRIGAGAIVMATASVDVHASLGAASVLWPNVTVSHNAQISENVFLSPGVVICGAARIGAHSFIGAGSVIVDHADLPEGSFLRMLSAYKLRR